MPDTGSVKSLHGNAHSDTSRNLDERATVERNANANYMNSLNQKMLETTSNQIETMNTSNEESQEYSIRGTQTALTLIDETTSRSRESDRESRYAVSKPAEFGTAAISVELNTSQQASRSTFNEDDKSSPSVRSTFHQFRLDEVTVKFSHEAATQATPPHPSLMSAKSDNPRDIFKIATSVSSDRSGPRSEVLTVTTDYATRTPEATSLSLDVVDHDHPRRYINLQPSNPTVAMPSTTGRLQLSRAQGQTMAPPYNDQQDAVNFLRRCRFRRWGLQNCFRGNDQTDDDPDSQPYTPIPPGPPPTYSSIFAEGRPVFFGPRIPLATRSSDESQGSFVLPVPPPSYAQTQGLRMDPYSMEQIISVTPTRGVWSARPMAAICPRCTAVIVTVIEVRRSTITHVSALILFLFGCWPCCLIPYCISACKRIDHYCPVCRTHLGTYNPW